MPDRSRHDPRLAATRLTAVQAIYEMSVVEAPLDDVLDDFAEDRWASAPEDEEAGDGSVARPKATLLRNLVAGTLAGRSHLDQLIGAAVTSGKRAEDLELLLLSLLRAGAYEFSHRPDVPARAIIKAYQEVGDAFFDEDGPQASLIAGVLNGLARQLRSDEFTTAEDAPGGR